MKTPGASRRTWHDHDRNKPSNNALLGLNLPQKSIMGVILLVALFRI